MDGTWTDLEIQSACLICFHEMVSINLGSSYDTDVCSSINLSREFGFT